MKRFRAHTHFVYLLCMHSHHMSHVTLAHYCFMLLCVHVSCNSFPVVVRKRPRMHLGCLFLREGRRWRMPLASPLVSPILVKRRSRSAAWPRNETAEYDQRLLEFFCGFDRRFPTAEWNRRSYLTLFNLSGWNGGLIGGSETAEWNRRICPVLVRSILRSWSAVCGRRIETPMFPCLSRDSFGGPILRPGRRMKPPIGMFQGQCGLFTWPLAGLYKYIFFSCSSYHSENQEPYFHKREKAF